jgi:hypothetical protein
MTRGDLTTYLCNKPESASGKGQTFAARKRELLLSFIVLAAPLSAAPLTYYIPARQATKAVPLWRVGVKHQRPARGESL